MYKSIVLAYDGSEAGRQALMNCKEIAHWTLAELSLLAVMPYSLGVDAAESSVFVPEDKQKEVVRYRAVLEDGLRQLTNSGFIVRGELLVGEPVQEIAKYARTHGANLIVVGHKHLNSWAARWWSGAISGDLITHAHCSVLCVITN
jgi:nucleotide-binding universal stress UspA family protein